MLPPLPRNSASNYYSKSKLVWNFFQASAVLYTAVSHLTLAVVRPLPLLNRLVPPVHELPSDISGSGKVAVVTGANTGIGFETATQLVERGFTVVLACRSQAKAEDAKERIQDQVGPQAPGKAVIVGTLDLSNIQSVQDFSVALLKKHKTIDLLVNNAGLNTSGKSEYGLDLCFQANFLGHFLLTQLIMNALLAAPDPRVVNLSSVMHHFCQTEGGFDSDYWSEFARYGVTPESSYTPSKLAALLFTIELNRRYGAQGLRSIAVNPGAVNSDIWRGKPRYLIPLFRLLYLTNRQGSHTTVAACTVSDLDNDTVYLQPYYQPLGQRTPFPATEMLGPFVGYQAVKPRLPLDATNGRLSGQVLWETSNQLLADVAPNVSTNKRTNNNKQK